MDLADVVHQGKQPPLHIHLGLGAQGELVQSFLNADIGEHRLDDCQASGVDLFTMGGVNLGFHFIDQIGHRIIHPDRQVPARRAGFGQTA